MRGYGPILSSLRLVSTAWRLDARMGILSWYARVPTVANISDGPSRLNKEDLEAKYNCVFCKPVFPKGHGPRSVLK